MRKLHNRFGVIFAILAAILTMAAKTVYIQNHYRFMPFGFDTPRIVGYTQSLFELNNLNPFSSLRFGMIMYMGFWVKALNLTPSQTALPALWTINLGLVFSVAVITYTLTHNKRISAQAAFIAAVSAMAAPVNESHFAAYIILPLRFTALWLFIKPNIKKITSMVWFWPYVISVFITNLSYPILGIVGDCITLFMLYVLTLNLSLPVFMSRIILITQLIAYAGLFVLYQQAFRYELTIFDFIERVYATAFLHIDRKLVAKVIGLVLTGELISVLWIPSFHFRQDVHKLIKSTQWKIVLRSAHAALALFAIIRWFPYMKMVVPENLTSSVYNNQIMYRFLIQLILILIWCAIGSKRFWKKLHSPLREVAIGVTVYVFLFLFVLPFFSEAAFLMDGRFTTFFFPWFIAMLAIALFSLPKNIKSLAISIYCCLAIVFSWQSTKVNYRLSGDRPVLKAMDWLSTQPNHNQVLYYAPYFANPNLAGHEQYDGSYFVPSIVPLKDQRALGKCTQSDSYCTSVYQQYISTHALSYLVLENGDKTPIYQQLENLGKMVYQDGSLKIIKLK